MRRTIVGGVAILWLFLGVWPAWARLPQEADYTTLANAINTNPALTTLVSQRKWPDIAVYYNETATPDYWILRESVPLNEVYENYSPDNTLWPWATFFTLPLDNLERWRELWRFGAVDPRKDNLVPAIQVIMPGAPYLTLRNFLLAMRRRLATRAEVLFTTGTGDGSTADPSITRLTVAISGNDVVHALTGAPLL